MSDGHFTATVNLERHMIKIMPPTASAANRAVTNALARAATAKPELDPAVCWQAVYSRDRRFDGRLFVGIAGTGVYCRSTCPASFGRPARVRWFPSTGAAEAAGFRPCKRCRPDTSPGSSAWFGTLAVVSHALQLISQGALDNGNLEQLCECVGIGSRHLRRLFERHLGASPLKIARSHRVHVARDLILETNTAIAEIASRTGFRSIRQFNHAVRATFGQPPTKLRLRHGMSGTPEPESGLVVHLPYRPPFEWPGLLEFFKERITPDVEAVDGDFYRRTIEIGDVVGAIEVWHEAGRSRLSMRIINIPSCGCLMQIVQRVRRMFDLEADVVQIGQHLSQDAALAEMLAARPGLRVPGVWDGFELAVRAVLGQQLTVVDGKALARRLVRTFGRPLRMPVRGLSHLFPRPEILAGADLATIGVPADQAAAIGSLAQAVLAGKLSFDSGKGLRSALSWLRAHPGLNEGAASYIAMRSFGEPDALPHTDLGLRRALAARGRPVSPTELLGIFEKFTPWRAYAAMHFLAVSPRTA
jgi:AraC family transcriptional regulator of adaptative response / DNA-3-methyladenine glycosylase II